MCVRFIFTRRGVLHDESDLAVSEFATDPGQDDCGINIVLLIGRQGELVGYFIADAVRCPCRRTARRIRFL